MLAALLAPAADIPRAAPAMTFRKVEGGVIDLKQYRGKVVALEFLLTTCPHCQKGSQFLQKMQDEFGPKGFQAVGVAFNEMAHMLVPEYMKNFGIRFPVGFAQREQVYEFLQESTMVPLYAPQLVIIDGQGRIRFRHQGFREDEEKTIRARIEELVRPSVKR
jgi:peroxiredoxin